MSQNVGQNISKKYYSLDRIAKLLAKSYSISIFKMTYKNVSTFIIIS